MATVLWQDVETGALDRCRMEAGPQGLRLSGTVLTPAHGTPSVAFLDGQGGSRPAGSTGSFTFDDGDLGLGDIFSSIFSGGGGTGPARRGPQRGRDVETEVTLDFTQAVRDARARG